MQHIIQPCIINCWIYIEIIKKILPVEEFITESSSFLVTKICFSSTISVCEDYFQKGCFYQ